VSRGTFLDLCYLVAAITFILALKGLSSPKHARRGNLVAACGMALAIGATFAQPHLEHLWIMIVAMAVGTAVAVPTSRFVKMTAIPQLVAIFNGVGGGSAALVSVTKFVQLSHVTVFFSCTSTLGASSCSDVFVGGVKTVAVYKILEVVLGVIIGTVSFSGSAIAFAKLQELMTGRPVTYPAQQPANAVLGVAVVTVAILLLVTGSLVWLWVLLGLAVVLGVAFVLPIGGADVPVLISLLNSFTGIAVAASGFTIGSNLLIVAGTLVGASGLLLTRMMSSAMGRSLPNILFSAFGSVVTASQSTERDGRSVRTGTAEDIGVLLAYARKVVIIPGYGLAVAQAQHVVRELAEELQRRGVEVFFAIHPVAGRMPGHMNVLLAEANVPYDELREMDEANPEVPSTDVALVVGANDTVNPAALDTPGSPIYGMPIIHADAAAHVVFLKRSMRPGFAGIDNDLLYNDKTVLLFGDAKDTLTKLVAAVKAA
jgi:H+-translocating NAD(P) transhydrogenase subunit beta